MSIFEWGVRLNLQTCDSKVYLSIRNWFVLRNGRMCSIKYNKIYSFDVLYRTVRDSVKAFQSDRIDELRNRAFKWQGWTISGVDRSSVRPTVAEVEQYFKCSFNLHWSSYCGEGVSILILFSKEIKYPASYGISHRNFLIEDEAGFDIFGIFESAHEFISFHRKRTNVLVHCVVGASRSATVVLSYLMKKWGMTLDDALSHVITVRSIINPNAGFIRQLLEYELLLFSKVHSQLTIETTFHYYVQSLDDRFRAHPLDQLDSPFYRAPGECREEIKTISKVTSPSKSR